MTSSFTSCVFCAANPRNCPETNQLSDLENKASRFGFCPSVVQAAIRLGEEWAVIELSNALISETKNRRKLAKNTGAAPVFNRLSAPKSLVERLTVAMLDACEDTGEFPLQFNELLRVALNRPHRWKNKYSGVFIERALQDANKLDSREQAALLIAQNPNASNREVAEMAGVNHTTIRRWRTEPDFQKLIDQFSNIKNISRLSLFPNKQEN
jgi:hypothetical protein